MVINYKLDDGSVVPYVPKGYTGTALSNRGDIHYYLEGNFHRDNDEPAIIAKSGRLTYCKYGQTHRECGPAFIWIDGDCEYIFKDKLHNTRAPAFDYVEVKMHYLLNFIVTEKSTILLVGDYPSQRKTPSFRAGM